METQDSYPTTTDPFDTSMNVDFSGADQKQQQRSRHHHQNSDNNEPNSNGSNRAIRQSLLPSSTRRSTMVFRSIDHSQPPVDNPNNTPEVNAQRHREYEQVQLCNHVMETCIQDFKQTAKNIKNFNDKLDETNQLLDLWVQILSVMQQTKQPMEVPSPLEKKSTSTHELPVSMAPLPPTTTTTTTTTNKPTVASAAATTATTTTKSIRAPAPVGTHMTKKPKISYQKRR